MQTILSIVALLLLAGCTTTPDKMITILRPVAENKSANIQFTGSNFSLTIQTRVVGDTNNSPLPPLQAIQNPK